MRQVATIPSSLIEPIAQAYIDEKDLTWELLSLRMGLHKDSLRHQLATGKVTWRLVDNLFCKMGDPIELWTRPEMLDYYWEGSAPPDPMKPVKCANPECEDWFELTASALKGGKEYCSRRCSHRVRNLRFRATVKGKLANQKNSRRDYQRHRDARRAQMNRYYQEHAEERKAKMREYRRRKKMAVAA